MFEIRSIIVGFSKKNHSKPNCRKTCLCHLCSEYVNRRLNWFIFAFDGPCRAFTVRLLTVSTNLEESKMFWFTNWILLVTPVELVYPSLNFKSRFANVCDIQRSTGPVLFSGSMKVGEEVDGKGGRRDEGPFSLFASVVHLDWQGWGRCQLPLLIKNGQ
jgi:hypothetical protein